MVTHAHTNVSAAFDILLEAMDEEIAGINRAVTEALGHGDYARARELVGLAERKVGMREQLLAFRGEWEGVPAARVETNGRSTRAPRRNLGRVGPGLRTREEAFYLPILQTLDEMGGVARASEALERVKERMEHVLKPADLDPLPSNPNMPRWRNSALWARHYMAKEGLVKSDTPHGIWEISEQGREYLRRAREQGQRE